MVKYKIWKIFNKFEVCGHLAKVSDPTTAVDDCAMIVRCTVCKLLRDTEKAEENNFLK